MEMEGRIDRGRVTVQVEIMNVKVQKNVQHNKPEVDYFRGELGHEVMNWGL
jgi:hypothetical protein